MGGAFVVIVILYIQHHLESSRGILSPMHKVGDRTDHLIENLKVKTNGFIAHLNRRTVSFFLHSFFVYIGRGFVRLSDKVYEVSSHIVEKASQRKENLSKAGAPSFYVKQIKEVKGEMNGNAEDELPRPREDERESELPN